jgi:arylsulfatase A-like enzyme
MFRAAPLFVLISTFVFQAHAIDAALRPMEPAPARNVLFLIADDLNCDLGCYGGPALTPNIDRLAAKGTRFERAYCQVPWCSPSRSSFLTGRKPDVTGVKELPTVQHPVSPHFREFIPKTVTLPELFKHHGAFTARVGKLYHYGVPEEIGTGGLDDPQSWSMAINPRGLDREIHDRIFSLIPGHFGGTLSWLAAPGVDEEHTDGMVASETIKLLERFAKSNQRFFLAAGFYRPHTPFVAPQKWFDLYPLEKIRLPELSEADRTRQPAVAYASAQKVQDAMSELQRREAIQAYLAASSFMDAQVGRIMEALERLAMAENTVIVFTSDHGYHLGDHGLWQKRSLFERSARVPLILSAPGLPAGQVAPAPVGLIDVFPTLTGIAGLPAPEYLDGQDLTPALKDAKAVVNRAVFSQVYDGYSVRTERWRYTEWSEGRKGAVLFDMVADPGETKNLAADPENAGAIAELKELLAAYRPKNQR